MSMNESGTDAGEMLDGDFNAYAALILLVNAYWRKFMTEAERLAVAGLPEDRSVRLTMTAAQVGQMGFDESLDQLHEMFAAVQGRWDDDFDGILPLTVGFTPQGAMALDIESEVMRALILVDDEEEAGQ